MMDTTLSKRLFPTRGQTRYLMSSSDEILVVPIGTWNVRTLLQTRKLENLKIEMKRLRIDTYFGYKRDEMEWTR